MATKVKGITIELNADVSGLETALKNANKELNATQRQLNSVNKSLKLDPGNTALLEQKQRMLATAVEQTTQKINALKRAQDQIKQQGGEGAQSQYDALTREISDATVKLTGFQKEQQAVGQALQSAGSQTNAFTSGLQSVGSAAQSVAEKTRGLSMAAAGALAGMAALATNAAAQADEWLTLAQQTGLSTDAIQEFAYAAEQIDVPLPTITSAITNMKKHLGDTSGLWEHIGVEVRAQGGAYRDVQSIFFDTVRALGNIKNETERDTQAMKIFGKSANELAGLIDDGGAKMRELGDEAHNMGGIISNDDLQKLGAFDDALQKVKNSLKMGAMSAALPIVEAMLPLIQAMSESLQGLGVILQALPSPVVAILGVALLFVAVLSPLASGVAHLTTALESLSTTLPQLGTAIGQLASNAASMIASNPYVAMVLLIIAALVALGVVIYQIIKHWDEFKAAGQSAINSIQTSSLGQKFTQVGQTIASALKKIPEMVHNIAGAFSPLISAASNMVSKVMGIFSQLTDKAFKIGSEVMGAFAQGIRNAINQVTAALQNLIRTLASMWQTITNDARRAGNDTGNAYVQAYNQSSSNLKAPTTSTFTSSLSSLTSSLRSMSAANMSASTPNYTSAAPANVTVELVGSAKDIFSTVRVQNNKLTTATGYHALA